MPRRLLLLPQVEARAIAFNPLWLSKHSRKTRYVTIFEHMVSNVTCYFFDAQPKKGRPPAEYNNHDYSSSQAQAVGIDRGRGPRVKKDMQSEPRPIQCHESYQNQLAMQNAAATPTSHAANGLPSISPSKSYNVNDGNASTDVYLNRSKNLPSQKRLLAQAAAVQGNLIVDPEVEPQLLADLSLAQLHQQALATTSPSKLLEQYSQVSSSCYLCLNIFATIHDHSHWFMLIMECDEDI